MNWALNFSKNLYKNYYKYPRIYGDISFFILSQFLITYTNFKEISMFNFIDEISKIADLPLNEVTNSYKLVFVGGNVLYISNYKKILTITPDFIAIKVKSNVLNIEGINFSIKQLSRGELILMGKINKIYCS